MTMKWRGGSKDSLTGTQPPESTDAIGQVEILEPNSLNQLETNDTAKGYIAEARSRMGMLARFKFDRHTTRELRRVSGEIAVNYLNAQKEVMIDKISASVALEKRANLREFLAVAVNQDKELRVITDNAEKEMTNLIEDEAIIILEEKKIRIDSLDERLRNKTILEEDYAAIKDMHTQAAETLIIHKFDRMAKISSSYVERFDQALEGYKERFVDYKGVI